MEYDLFVLESFDFGSGSGIFYTRGERVSCPQEIRAILGRGTATRTKVRWIGRLGGAPPVEQDAIRLTDTIALSRP